MYQQADAFYNAATANASDEKKESLLNAKALKAFQKLGNLLPGNLTVFDSLRFFTAFKTGELQHYFENFSGALDAYQESISIQKKSHLPDSLIFKPLLYSGLIYYNQNHYDTSTLFFSQAEKVNSKYGNSLDESERLYNLLGVLHYEQGDYRQAKNYFLKAIEVLPKSHPYYRELNVNYRINLAQIYFKNEDYDQANDMYQSLLPENANTNEILHNIGTINLYLGAPKKALEYFKKAEYSSNRNIRLYNNIAQAYLNLDMPDSARRNLQYAKMANIMWGKNTDPVAYGMTLEIWGDLEMELHHPDSALSFYQRAIQKFYPSFTDTSSYSNPETYSGVFSYINLFNCLAGKAEAIHEMYVRSKDINWAKKELDTYHSAFQLTDYVERTYDSDEARLFLNRIKYQVHGKPIDIAYELYRKTSDPKYLEELYVFDQQNKASVLSLRQETSHQTNLNDSSLAASIRSVKSEITRLSLRAQQVNDSTLVPQMNNRIRDLEIQLGKLQDELTKTTGNISQIPSVKSLQEEMLDKQTALLSFHLSDSTITTLAITKDSYNVFQKRLFPGFHDDVEAYVGQLRHANDTAFRLISRRLYTFLFSQLNVSDKKRWLIIPDDELNYLAFESLLDEKENYTIASHSIQYQYTTALLKKETSDFSRHETLAFAPFTRNGYYDSSLHLDPLPNSWKEIENIRGKKFSGAAATKQQFLSSISVYPVIHLATHAVAQSGREDLSFVAFSPSTKNSSDFLLYEEEIYNLPLDKTKLIMLSACETASGDLVRGEGIMSLSRAFTYAGCPDMLTTLWNANDFSSAYLTGKVHHYLDKNYSIDHALQQAKLDYLHDKSINPRLKHPFYWAHFIFIGNYAPEKESSVVWWILGGVLILVLIATLGVRSRY